MKKHYKYKLKNNESAFFSELVGITFSNQWCSIKDGVITVFKGYAWDGCSPRYEFNVFGKRFVVGVPNGRKDQLRIASLFHDVFCQFSRLIDITKKSVNQIFKRCMLEVKWVLWPIYFFAVELYLDEKRFGGYVNG